MDSPVLYGHSLSSLLRGVHPNWCKIFDMQLLVAAIQSVAKKVGTKRISPAPELIFEPFRYGGPEDQNVVILGQDPYPDEKDGQGICFSAPRTAKTPESLKKIFNCL